VEGKGLLEAILEEAIESARTAKLGIAEASNTNSIGPLLRSSPILSVHSLKHGYRGKNPFCPICGKDHHDQDKCGIKDLEPDPAGMKNQ
jgi:hypothetical protein